MKKLLMKAIKTSISEVMETMFFLPVEFGRQVTLAQFGMDKKNTMACRLAFTGDSSGRLILLAPINLIVEMAENFMGEPRETLTEDYFSGTLTEMLNMVCGNALSKTNSLISFKLGIPQIINVSEVSENEVFTIVETMDSKMAVLLEMN
jgi:CheY-specific phosphatase CheX